MSWQYVRCTRCEAGIDMDTGRPCENCDGGGGVWVLIDTSGGIRIEVRRERPEDEVDEP